jgi:hypothetical protein
MKLAHYRKSGAFGHGLKDMILALLVNFLVERILQAHAVTAGGILAHHKNGVGVACQPDVGLCLVLVRTRNRKRPLVL